MLSIRIRLSYITGKVLLPLANIYNALQGNFCQERLHWPKSCMRTKCFLDKKLIRSQCVPDVSANPSNTCYFYFFIHRMTLTPFFVCVSPHWICDFSTNLLQRRANLRLVDAIKDRIGSRIQED